MGLRKMRGEAKSKDILSCLKLIRVGRVRLRTMDAKLDGTQNRLKILQEDVVLVHRDMGMLLKICKAMLSNVHFSIHTHCASPEIHHSFASRFSHVKPSFAAKRSKVASMRDVY